MRKSRQSGTAFKFIKCRYHRGKLIITITMNGPVKLSYGDGKETEDILRGHFLGFYREFQNI